jgi:hypothetical protein
MASQFDPTNVAPLRSATLNDLAIIPRVEDDRFEFKSSLTPDGDLRSKIAKAASGFWNSGGGFLVAGVGADGRPDGGLSARVGNQLRTDWVDQVLSAVTPRGDYVPIFLEGPPTEGTLRAACGVLIIGFQESPVGPHMSDDGRYYVRAGAHTEPASHFIVEAIRARRGLSRPLLTYFLHPMRDTSLLAEFELVNLSTVAALDITARFAPPPPLMRGRSEEHVRVLTREYPARIPFTMQTRHSPGASDWEGVDQNFQVFIEYHDLTGRAYKEEIRFLPRSDLPRPLGYAPPLERIAQTLAQIDNKLSLLSASH